MIRDGRFEAQFVDGADNAFWILLMRTKTRVDRLTTDDLRSFPVWEYTNADEDGADETVVRPVESIPVESLSGRVVGTQVQLANGTVRWALMGNVDLRNERLTRHFLSLSVLENGRWFSLARYHDVDVAERGPAALAVFLQLPVDDVFPISYDITKYCLGARGALAGIVEKEPAERLTRAQIIALAVP